MFRTTQTGARAIARACLLASAGVLALAAPSRAKPSFITFDVGSTSTNPAAINSSGVVIGLSDGFDGFVRAADGTVTVFDVSGANGTHPISIGDDGTIAGWFFDSSYVQHSFVRTPDGTITTFDPPRARGNVAVGIDAKGFIAGSYTCSSGTCGYMRKPGGKIIHFEVSGSAYTAPVAINDGRSIAGYYLDSSNNTHGFLRSTDGTITDFDVSGAPDTTPAGINKANAVTGTYAGGDGNQHGFVRTSDGTITTFDAPQETFGTFPAGIDARGAIAGSYYTSNNLYGFLRTPDGTIKSFGVKGALGTAPSAINDSHVVTGYYIDSNYNSHGFIRMP